jgi:hypothetical protein
VLRASVISVFRIIHANRFSLTEDPLIQAFFEARRKANVRPPKPAQLEIWDVDLLIKHRQLGPRGATLKRGTIVSLYKQIKSLFVNENKVLGDIKV